jgi:hypothetical protein
MEEFIEGIKMLGKLEKGQNIDILREYDETRKALFETISSSVNIKRPIEITTTSGNYFKIFPDGDIKIISGISGDEYFLSGMDLEKIFEIFEIYGKELLDAVKTLDIINKVKSILNR